MSVLITRYREARGTDAEAYGATWYPEAKREARRLSRDAGITLAQAAGIIASASLNQSWKGNLTIARKLGRGEQTGLTRVRRECAAILAGTPPTRAISGPKRVCFYRNIMGDTDTVTVDRWAARAADAESLLPRVGGYEKIADMYRDAASKLNVTPRELQAIVWSHVRGSHA